jgi:hypothetical protein
MEGRLRLSGLLLILGLLTEAVCLFWAHPLSFVALVGFGGVLLFLGVVVYLLSLISIKLSSPNSDS